MGDEDDRKDGDLTRDGNSPPATEGVGDERRDATLTPPGTTVNLGCFKDVYLGITTGAGFKFPIIAGSDLAGQSWFGSYSILADGQRKFEGLNLASSREVVTLQSTGGIPALSICTRYFQPGGGDIYKIMFNTGVSYVPLSQCTLPTITKVGESGRLGSFSGSDYTTVTVAWRLIPGCNGSSFLEISYSIEGEAVTASEVDRFLLDATGKPVSVTLSATTMGTTVTLSGKCRVKGLLDGD